MPRPRGASASEPGEATCHTPAVDPARRCLLAVLVVAVGACGGPASSIQPTAGPTGAGVQGGKGLTGTITLVEDWHEMTDWTKRSLTVNVLLKPAAEVTGLFEDDGSSYAYAGSSFSHADNGSNCSVEVTRASTGSGAFGSSDRSIELLIDESPGRAGLGLSVQFTTSTSTATKCFGETKTIPPSDDQDGWVRPACGVDTGSELRGTVDQNGTIDFTCIAPSGAGTRTLTVSGSLTHR